MSEYGARLQALMDKKPIDRTRLAAVIGVTYHAIKKVLDGKSEFSASNLFVVANFFAVNAEWLATGKGAMLPTISMSSATTDGPHVVAARVTTGLESLTADLLALDGPKRRAVAGLLAQYAVDPVANAALLPAIELLLAPALEPPQAKQA